MNPKISATSKERQQNMLRHFPTILARWSGADARLKELTVSHLSLRIEARLPNQPSHLRVACIEPMLIHAPIRWTISQLQVALTESGNFELRDDQMNIRIVAGKIEIAEITE